MAKYKNISEQAIAVTYPDKSSKQVAPGEEFLLSPLLAKPLLEQGQIEAIASLPPAGDDAALTKKPRKGLTTDGSGDS